MRRLVTVRCTRKGHVLAELLAAGDGLRVRIPRCGPPAIWRPAAAPPRRAGTGITRTRLVEEPPGRKPYPAMCSCGMHPVSGDDLIRANAAGMKVITLDPVPV